MSTTQKALIVRTGPDGHEGLDELNIELERGWTVAEVAPMGGAGGATDAPVVAALVILEHNDRPETEPQIATEAVEIEEEKAEEVVDEVVEEMDDVVEGDGI
ncbi:hypothetical protein CRI94_05035 [Longibacter salinarum]|uniref:Uncharacterized protein n=1 Tax=Longibacter salinarum TaxID=1850348 RepID=A0A2A8D175_9BACT|nr:hypothetical protein [Longibacter salinarum]PEN14398.1 hypothetical protein CRI94_05035 [Longibacter salinarum]